MATVGLSKVFILDKYFTELQKFWETERKLQDASSSNEAVHLQQRLQSLSTELVTLRSHLHTPTPPDLLSPSAGLSTFGPQKLPAPLPHTQGPQKGHVAQPIVKDISCSKLNGGMRSGHHSVSSTSSRNTGAASRSAGAAADCAELEDLIHLPGPLTEDAVVKCIQARFNAGHHFTHVGPILLALNPCRDVGNPLTLSSTLTSSRCPQLLRVVQEAVRQQAETGYPQAIILSGCSGSGKTLSSMVLLRQLFEVAGGGPETDAFKHLAAAFTVLRSLGSAKTTVNSDASRIGHFIEVQVTDGALYRTKIHCYFLDQTRVVRPLQNEKNYHIFYQMLAGLTPEERAKLHLEKYSIHNLCYLNCGNTKQDEAEDARRFRAWKSCLAVLGIPFLDVVRVLASVLLLGNVHFADGSAPATNGGSTMEVRVRGEQELKAVAALLGVTESALFQGLTTRTHNVRGKIVKSVCDANMSNQTRDSLAKALYCRTVATIVRRTNSLKRIGSTSGTLSSDSTDSVHNQAEVASQHASTVGTAGSKSSKSMTVLNNAVRHATDGFIGILDMFGFEEPKPSELEHLCINLCAETMQHFYNTHIFKSSIESCRDEGIHCGVEVEYVDNVPCIDLVSSLRTGLLSMLDVECSLRGTAESYLQKVRVQHRSNPRLFDPKLTDIRALGIQHFVGKVVYDASDFLDTNKDIIPDDVVSVFHKHHCGFGFASHLFGSELKALYSQDVMPRGISFRISPTSHSDLLNGDEPVSTLTQDFHTRLDNLLRTLVHAKPHFIRCVRTNQEEKPSHFDRAVVVRQVRALQVLETVNLMAGGYPHRMRFKAFIARYKILAPFRRLKRNDDKALEDCNLILQCFQHALSEMPKVAQVSTSWALGKRHIFLGEGARQQLELLRAETRHRAAVLVQATWRGWHFRQKWAASKRNGGTDLVHAAVASSLSSARAQTSSSATLARPRPQPIAGTPPPEVLEHNNRCDSKTIQQTCSLFGLDLERPPPLPPSRTYTVAGNTKMGYPQIRIMKMTFPEGGKSEVVLGKGDMVTVVGASPRRGHLVVEHNSCTIHVPFRYLELKMAATQVGVNI